MSWPDLTKVTLIGRFLVKFLITAFNRVPGRVPQLRPKMSQRTKFIFVQKKAFYDRTAQKRLEFRSEKFLFVISIHGKNLNFWFFKILIIYPPYEDIFSFAWLPINSIYCGFFSPFLKQWRVSEAKTNLRPKLITANFLYISLYISFLKSIFFSPRNGQVPAATGKPQPLWYLNSLTKTMQNSSNSDRTASLWRNVAECENLKHSTSLGIYSASL